MSLPDSLAEGGRTLPAAADVAKPSGFAVTSDPPDSVVQAVALAPVAAPELVRQAVRRGVMKRCTHCGARLRSRNDRCPMDGAALETLPDPLLGEVLAGRYRIEGRIGAGGMSTVYRAQHQFIQRELAVKILLPSAASDPSLRRRFVREAQTIHRISHRHIVDMIDFGETDAGEVFLVMEYLHGATLARHLQQGALPAARAVDIVRQIALALARAHELDVVHRDIKPSNVFLSQQDGELDYVKLLDFGISKILDDSSTQTEAGMLLGTPEYMSPEQVRGEPVGPRSDLYSLGCVLYEALSGSRPFEGPASEVMARHLHEAPPPLRVSSIPPALENTVFRLLAKRAEDRHRNAHHLLEELRVVQASLPSAEAHPPSPTVRQSGPPLRSRRTVNLDEQALAKRVQVYRRLAVRVHGEQGVPTWLMECLDAVEVGASRAQALRTSLSQCSERHARSDRDAQATRLRIGLALDQLACDKSKLDGEIATLRTRAQAAEDAQTQLLDQLTQCVERTQPGHGAWADPLYAIASAFARCRRELDALRQELDARARVHADLLFQIRELKGRLDSFNDRAQAERDRVATETNQWGHELRELVGSMIQGLERAYEHLARFPELMGALTSP